MTIDATKPKLIETYDPAHYRPESRIGLTKDNPKVDQWRRHPGTMDVLGTDTPPSITAPTVLTQRPTKLDRSSINIGRGRGPRITPRFGRLK